MTVAKADPVTDLILINFVNMTAPSRIKAVTSLMMPILVISITEVVEALICMKGQDKINLVQLVARSAALMTPSTLAVLLADKPTRPSLTSTKPIVLKRNGFHSDRK